jgi:hypothetical protein
MKIRTRWTAVLSLFLAVVVPWASAVAAEMADYVFKNGAVYTFESKNPKAEAVAVTGKKISYVGSNKGANAFIGKKTKVIDLKGKMLLPGFVESHIHPTLALFAAGADLQTDSVDEVLGRRSPRCQGHPRLRLALYVVSDDGPDQGGSGQALSR